MQVGEFLEKRHSRLWKVVWTKEKRIADDLEIELLLENCREAEPSSATCRCV